MARNIRTDETLRKNRSFKASDTEYAKMKLNAQQAGYVDVSKFIRDRTIDQTDGKVKADPDLRQLIKYLDDLSNIRKELHNKEIDVSQLAARFDFIANKIHAFMPNIPE